MEEEPLPETNETPQGEDDHLHKKVIESKKYELNLEEDIYSLILEMDKKEISFILRKTSSIDLYKYLNKYEYNNLIKIFYLQNELYPDLSKIFQFIDKALTKKKVKLEYNKEKNKILFKITKPIDFEEIECKLELNIIKIEKDEIISLLIDEINELKNYQNENKKFENRNKYSEDKNNILEEEKPKNKEYMNKIFKEKENNNNINELKAKNEEIENNIKNLENKDKILEEENAKNNKHMNINQIFKEENNVDNNTIKELKEKNKEYENRIKNLEDKNKILEEEIKKNKEYLSEIYKEKNKKVFNNFKENPKNLKFKFEITKKRADSGTLDNIELFIGLKDRKEYIIYNPENTSDLCIMRIYDQKTVTELKGHEKKISVIRYYLKDMKDYILSCDKNNLVIIWDIQNNYIIKYKIQSNYSGNICDALILFNIFDKDYILLSSNKMEEYSQLYEFKENTPLIKNICGTNENETAYMMLWPYDDNYYIIDCCFNSKISINNLLKEENYAILSETSEGSHCCCYIYNYHYLCVSDWDNYHIKIWDLKEKKMLKKISISFLHGCAIIPWNNIYAIVGCNSYFVIINIEEGKMINKIKFNDKHDLRGLKKMKIDTFGECLICSSQGGIIGLFDIKY